jgi:hypothetical protein
MPAIEDFFGTYKFHLQGNTNPLTYPPGQPLSISASPTRPGTALLSWKARGQEHRVDQVPFNGQELWGRDLTGYVGEKTYPVDVAIALAVLAIARRPETPEEKTVTGDLFGQSAGPLVGQWGAETPPPPVRTGPPVHARADIQTAIA